MSFLNTDIMSLHAKLVNKEVTATELVEQAFAQYEAVDGDVHAFISTNKEKALEQAKAVDSEGVQVGEYLKGIPVALKDNILIKGEKATAGSHYLENYEAIFDSTVYSKLQEAGAIVIGKTNMDEFAMGGTTETSYFGKTANPWNLAKVPGGSSGGSAASVASGQVPAALGSDTGGSIRQPASFTGLVGMKPSYGLVSRFGLVAMSGSFDTVGPMTRTVKDNAAVLQAVAGYDEAEMTSLPDEVEDYLENIDAGVEGLTIGLVEEFADHEALSSEVKELIQAAVDALEAQGAQVKTISLPHAVYADDLYTLIGRAESVTSMHRYDGIRFGYRSENYDDLESLYVNSRTEAFGTETKDRIVEGAYIISKERIDDYFFKATQVRTLLKEDFDKAYEEVDVIITPITADVAHDLGSIRDEQVDAMETALAAMVNLAGLPALTLPVGQIQGLPVGMQIIGQFQDEARLYQAGQAFQSATDHHKAHAEMNGGNE